MNIFFIICIGILGLIIGSFLNVVIYRLPILSEHKKFNLCIPRSHCPNCKSLIPIWHNIPLLSYFILHGKCSVCRKHIPSRYPIVEFLSCALSIIIAINFGISWQTLALLFLTWALIVLVFIDFEHLILPDIITIPFIWLGLLVNSFNLFVRPIDAIFGAILGYLILWLIAKIFFLVRKIEGMGYGDFKLLAIFGAWIGWQTLPYIILLSSGLGLVVGLIFLTIKKRSLKTPIPFGPYIAISGWLMFIMR